MTNPWLKHVKQYHANHKHLTYKEALQKARASYKPMQHKGRGQSGSKVHPTRRSTTANMNDIQHGICPNDPDGAHLNANLLNTSRLLNASPEAITRNGTYTSSSFNPHMRYTGDLIVPSRRTKTSSNSTQYPHGINLNNLRTLGV